MNLAEFLAQPILLKVYLDLEPVGIKTEFNFPKSVNKSVNKK